MYENNQQQQQLQQQFRLPNVILKYILEISINFVNCYKNKKSCVFYELLDLYLIKLILISKEMTEHMIPKISYYSILYINELREYKFVLKWFNLGYRFSNIEFRVSLLFNSKYIKRSLYGFCKEEKKQISQSTSTTNNSNSSSSIGNVKPLLKFNTLLLDRVKPKKKPNLKCEEVLSSYLLNYSDLLRVKYTNPVNSTNLDCQIPNLQLVNATTTSFKELVLKVTDSSSIETVFGMIDKVIDKHQVTDLSLVLVDNITKDLPSDISMTSLFHDKHYIMKTLRHLHLHLNSPHRNEISQMKSLFGELFDQLVTVSLTHTTNNENHFSSFDHIIDLFIESRSIVSLSLSGFKTCASFSKIHQLICGNSSLASLSISCPLECDITHIELKSENILSFNTTLQNLTLDSSKSNNNEFDIQIQSSQYLWNHCKSLSRLAYTPPDFLMNSIVDLFPSSNGFKDRNTMVTLCLYITNDASNTLAQQRNLMLFSSLRLCENISQLELVVPQNANVVDITEYVVHILQSNHPTIRHLKASIYTGYTKDLWEGIAKNTTIESLHLGSNYSNWELNQFVLEHILVNNKTLLHLDFSTNPVADFKSITPVINANRTLLSLAMFKVDFEQTGVDIYSVISKSKKSPIMGWQFNT
ncbi:hypothetical protein DLAC_09222 [Tieghemostelium lacteum]|uniref:Uncharacterized protein n=1 Tax=Tieghemostelium lacteum TaxID=361077 RepID=A0A151Z9P3_TIELA|nr:hypothetical protein DLAC_09222 [Tieghemostelium lacteum]|eukprot:KYQ90594.1 hypothetical protein DLAC_09222 [Tieghemostelium lacteum]